MDQRSRVAWLVAIALVALNLRMVLTSVPPLAVALADSLHLSAAGVGALTTVPVACMGLFAPVTAWATRWIPETRLLAVGAALIAVGGMLRGFLGLVGLFGATVLAGIGIAIGGTLLPGLVRRRFPERVGFVTGLYTACLIVGSLLASSLAEPVRDALHSSPQFSLTVWGSPALLALVVWLVVAREPAATATTATPKAGTATAGTATIATGAVAGGRRPLPWRNRSAWLGTAFMAAQSLLFYGTLAWLAAANIEAGMSTHDAGLLLGLFAATQVVTAFAVPALAARRPRLWFGVSVGTTALGLWLVALIPNAFPAAPWLWAALVGVGMGGNFSLALTAVTQLAPTPADAPAFTGMAFLVGYLLTAAAPALLGLLADRTGGYRLPFLVLALVCLVTMGIGLATAARLRVGR